jgi:hypothetical protein
MFCRSRLLRAAMLVLTIALGNSSAVAEVTANQIAVPRAPMGWATWNSFASNISYAVVKAQVDAFVAAGLPAAGYRYINIDEGWWKGTRDGNGNITVDATQWPGGMTAIVNYIHSKGLKAGIYTDAGKSGCGYYFPTPSTQPAYAGTGIEGHELQDAVQFQNWGFDFVKVDWCGGQAEKLDPQTTYTRISNAITAATATTGRPMVLSLCDWGVNQPWNWAPGLGAIWRTSTDIVLFGNAPSTGNMLFNFDQTLHPTAQHTGYYNDPDMMMVGMPGFSAAQNQTHMGLWAIVGAPLIAGNNLTQMTASTTAILTNSKVIAIAQDPRGLQGVKVAEDSSGLQVYSKILSGAGNRAVLLLNRTSAAAPITVRWADIGLSAVAAVQDAWSGTGLGSPATGYTASVAAGASVLLTVAGTETAGVTYEAEATGNTLSGTAVVASCANCSGGSEVNHVGKGATLRFNGINAAAAGVNLATVAYMNGDSVARTATLQVNGQVPTTASFPPTGSWSTPGTVSLLLSLAKGSTNTITFSNANSWTPDFDAVAIQPINGTNGVALVGKQSGRCLDIPDNSIVDATQANLWDCNGGPNQTLSVTSRSELSLGSNKCLDAYNNGTTNGTKVVIWSCNGQTNQKWSFNSNGTVTNQLSGLCLDVTSNGSTNGTPLQLWACVPGSLTQQWLRR